MPSVEKTGSSNVSGTVPTSPAAGSEKSAAATAKPGTTPTTADRPTLAHDKRKALGRGLDSLLPGPRVVAPTAGTSALDTSTSPGAVSGVIAELHGQAAPRKTADGHTVMDIAVELVDENPHQTRSFNKREIESLQELCDSVREHGVIQPITVRPGKDGRYVLITGERRLRASKMASKETVPAIVRVVSEQQAAEMTVIENLQRRDLNCVDLANAYIMLSQEFGMTQEQIGQRMGIARETVANYMRLSKLPEGVLMDIRAGKLEFSHARILMKLDPEVVGRVAHKAVMDQMSVERLEHFVLFDKSMFPGNKTPTTRQARWVDPNVRAAQRKLEEILGVRVRIKDRKGKGKITLEYATLEDFDRVLEMLTGKKKQ